MVVPEQPDTTIDDDGGRGRPRILFVSHYAGKTGAPLLLLHFLRWVHEHTPLQFETLLLEDGPLVSAFEELGRVHVVDVFGGPDPDSLEGRARTVGWSETADRIRSRRVAQQAQSLGRFDVVYLNSALSTEALRLLPAIPPVVITSLHESDTAFSRFISRQDRELILSESDWYITCADVVTATLVGGFEVDPTRVRRHHGFVAPMEPDPSGGAAVREQLGIDGDAFVIGGIGVRQWRKGPDLFLAMAAELVDRRPDLNLQFVWAGGADPHGDDPPVFEDAAHLGIADRFHAMGEYDGAAPVFGAFDVFCLPSREDAFPLVMLEAALLEVPVVAFDSGGVSEFAAATGDASAPLALVVDYLDVEAMVDAMISLADDPDGRAAMADRARRHVLAEHVTDVGASRLYDELRRLEPAFRGARTTPIQPSSPGPDPT